jgi:transcriptional regulator with XRE-family HTH domain
VRTYGEQLKALRGKVSQEAIAKRMGYKRQGNLSLYENDKKRPSVKTVLRHARAFGKTPSEFLTDVIVTEYDRIRAGQYDDDAVEIDVRPLEKITLGEATVPPTTKRRRHAS